MARKAKRSKENFIYEDAEKMSSTEIKEYMEEREIKFAIEYLVDGNATEAAIRAGYKPGRNNSSAAVQGSRLKRDERVRALRAALIREKAEDKDLSRENIVLKLLEIYGRCMQKEPVMVWDRTGKEWVESGEWTFDAKGAIRALEQIADLMGFEAPKKVDVRSDSYELFMEMMKR